MTSARTSLPIESRLDDLPYAVADHGIRAHEGDIDAVVAQLRRLGRLGGANGVLLDVLADRLQPPVARERALGRLLGLLRRPRDTAQRCAA